MNEISERSPCLSAVMFLNMTDTQRLCVSGAVAEVWNDSTPSSLLQNPSILPASTSQEVDGLSHLEDTSSVGTAALESASVVAAPRQLGPWVLV